MVRTTDLNDYDPVLQDLENQLYEEGEIEVDLKQIPLKHLRRYFLGKPVIIVPLAFRRDKTGKRYPLKVKISITQLPVLKVADISAVEGGLLEPSPPPPLPVLSKEFSLRQKVFFQTVFQSYILRQNWQEIYRRLKEAKNLNLPDTGRMQHLRYAMLQKQNLAKQVRQFPFLETDVWYRYYLETEMEKQRRLQGLRNRIADLLNRLTANGHREDLGPVQEKGRQEIKREKEKERLQEREGLLQKAVSRMASFVKRLFNR